MEKLTSRKNAVIAAFRALGRSGAVRREQGLFLCDGEKLLREALQWGAQVETVLWASAPSVALPEAVRQYCLPQELLAYVSPLKNSPGPVFSVAIQKSEQTGELRHVLVLDGVQDPGNVGTLLRTANAMGCGAVVLTGACADLYNPKTVRSTMGAIFRQQVLELDTPALAAFLAEKRLPLWGAVLSEDAVDVRQADLSRAAVAVGSEGQGLSEAVRALCSRTLIIPMDSACESLNAGVAGSILLWEMARRTQV